MRMNYLLSVLISACLGPLHVRSKCGVSDVTIQTSPDSWYIVTGLTELGQAAMENRPQDVERLVEKGCDINLGRYRHDGITMRSTPLMIAAMENNSQVAKKLLTMPGIDVNLKSPGGKRSALFYSAKGGAIGVIKLLGQAGAELNEPDDEGDLAAFMPYVRLWRKNKPLATQTFKTILSLGADLEARMVYPKCTYSGGERECSGFHNNTLLMQVARMADLEAVEFMLCKGVDTEAVNEDGQTALTIVKETDRIPPGFEEAMRNIIEILENPPNLDSLQCQQSTGEELEK